MLHRAAWLCLLALVFILPGVSPAAVNAAQETPHLIDTFTLPDIPLSSPHNALLADHPIANDRGMLLGGIGSDLWQGPDDADDEFWSVTDRGPNVELESNGRRIFPVPDFTPLILHLQATDGVIAVLDAVPIVNQDGEPVTGLPNLDNGDKKPWDVTGEERLHFNQDGLDPEGMVRTTNGEFWLADEYRPSLVKVDATGKVLVRFVPKGVELPEARYPVAPTLPAIYADREDNRGFEGLALSGDERTLYAVLQSPLPNEDEDPDQESRAGRILAVDVASGQPVAEYVYAFQEAEAFDCMPEEQTCDAHDMKLSGLVWLDKTRLLALERTDQDARLYLADLSEATDVLGTEWDDPDVSPAPNDLDDLADTGVSPLAKTQLVDLDAVPAMPDKIEGVTLIDEDTLAVINDNDFAIGEFDADGQHQGTGTKSQLLIVEIPPMP